MKILLVLSCLWIASLVILQAPNNKRAAKQNGTASADKAAKPEQGQPAPSNPLPSGTIVNCNQGMETASHDCHKDQSDAEIETDRQIAKFTKYLVWVGGLQFAVLAVQAVLFFQQKHIMGQHATHLESVAKAASSNAQAAVLQVQAMQGQITEMSVQSGILQESVNVSRDAAKAAKISADIAAAVSIPTLVVDDFDLGNPPGASLEAMLQFPTVKLTVKNYGQTSAFLRSWSVVFTCEDLPDVPNYGDHPGSGLVIDKIVIQPNTPYTFPPVAGWHRHEFSLDDVQAIMEGRKILNVYGCVCYWDIFGNPVRRLKFCETALNLLPGNNPRIEWIGQLAPNAYRGTDLMPIGLPTGTNAKTDNGSKQAN